MPHLPDPDARRWRFAFAGILSLCAAGLLLYAEKWAFAWDEAYHLLAAQLILAGKRPYLDFCFPQTPLNAYWNAAWMAAFGQSWRVPHLAAALLTIGAAVLIADYLLRRFPDAAWRTPAAVVAVLVIALNAQVVTYGLEAQPYALCLFGLALAFRTAVRAVAEPRTIFAAAAGLCAGIAVASSLLTAAGAPVLLVWLLVYNRAGVRWRKAAAFLIAAVVPFLPVAWLAVEGPFETWFNLVRYHATFRKLYWTGATRHDLEVLTSWIDSGQALLVGLLALFGILYVSRASGWARTVKSEFYLCAWLAVALAAEVGRAHPTFPQYFLLLVPFLAILAAAGLYAVASRALEPGRSGWAVALAGGVIAAGLARELYNWRTIDRWAAYERVAKKVDEVTPPGAPLLALEPIYFLTRRMPPPGFELYYTHKVDLPAAERARLHILTEAEVRGQARAGRFATVYACDEDDVESYGLEKLYRRKAELENCYVFWDRR